MDKTAFGKTGLEVSVLGLGGGGYSRLGTAQGASHEEAERVVRRALDLGVNLFDSAEVYGTETVFGQALSGVKRDEVVLCTKAGLWDRSPEDYGGVIDRSLANLRTDYIDVYQFHAVGAADYRQAAEDFLPVLHRARDAGKIRFVGVTEGFERDTRHEMLRLAAGDVAWDAMMVGCNILNFSAEDCVFPMTAGNGVGTLGMFAVRYALARPENLRVSVREMIEHGQLDPATVDPEDPLGFLLDECEDLPEAAYRFCRHLPGMDCVLSGTGSIEHLEANVRAVGKPPLSDGALARIRAIFGGVDSVSGKTPSSPW